MMTPSVRHITLGRFFSDESGQGSSASFLPPAQPALLTLTADGSMRIWVEVTVTPPTPPLPAPVSSGTPPQHPKPSQQVHCSLLLQRKPQRLSMYISAYTIATPSLPARSAPRASGMVPWRVTSVPFRLRQSHKARSMYQETH